MSELSDLLVAARQLDSRVDAARLGARWSDYNFYRREALRAWEQFGKAVAAIDGCVERLTTGDKP